jgi:hypothetical protein
MINPTLHPKLLSDFSAVCRKQFDVLRCCGHSIGITNKKNEVLCQSGCRKFLSSFFAVLGTTAALMLIYYKHKSTFILL